jgi:hypothetical protein
MKNFVKNIVHGIVVALCTPNIAASTKRANNIPSQPFQPVTVQLVTPSRNLHAPAQPVPVAWVMHRSLRDLKIPFERIESSKSACLPGSYQAATADTGVHGSFKLSEDSSAAVVDSLVVLDL